MNKRLASIGLTPAKAALVAVLAVGLVLVWGPQLLRQEAAAPLALRSPTGATAPQRTPRAGLPAGAVRTAEKRERAAATIGLAEALAHDPFATPAWSPDAGSAAAAAAATAAQTPDGIEERFDALRKSGAAMLLVSGAGRAAQVGDRTLRVGDVFDGFRVVAITGAGVVLEPAPADVEEPDAS